MCCAGGLHRTRRRSKLALAAARPNPPILECLPIRIRRTSPPHASAQPDAGQAANLSAPPLAHPGLTSACAPQAEFEHYQSLEEAPAARSTPPRAHEHVPPLGGRRTEPQPRAHDTVALRSHKAEFVRRATCRKTCSHFGSRVERSTWAQPTHLVQGFTGLRSPTAFHGEELQFHPHD